MTFMPDPQDANYAILANGSLGAAVRLLPEPPANPTAPTVSEMASAPIIGYVAVPRD
jgi:hypothetical protein